MSTNAQSRRNSITNTKKLRRHGTFANRQRTIAELPSGQVEGMTFAKGNEVEF
jgi:hypothetical protein